MYKFIEKWLNGILEQEIPPSVVGLSFNLYEDGEYNWTMELVGTESFDLEDNDWCCEEIFDFGTRAVPLSWKEKKAWNEILDKMKKNIKKYLDKGKYSYVLKKYQGVGIGFVDGDVEILFAQ